MAIAQQASPTNRAAINQLIKVGFSPEQAFAFWLGEATVDALTGVGKFARYQAEVLVNGGSLTMDDLIRKAKLTRPQAKVILRLLNP